MKNNLKSLILILLIGLTVVSCKKDDDEIIEPVDYTVTVNYGEQFENKLATNATIELVSTTSGKMYTAITGTQGVTTFTVIPDVYKITVKSVLTSAQFNAAFGYDSNQEEVSFNASEDNIAINKTTALEKTISLLTSKIGDLLFKQIYYGGSNIIKGAVIRDVFFEIYNNSNETIYADGLYFAQLFNNYSTKVKPYMLSDGRYDWIQSIGQTKGDKSNTDYCYADHIYQLPGTGQQYPIEPGNSIVIAANAINHKQPLKVGEKVFEIEDPSLTVDLTTADFEINLIEYFESIGKTPYVTDIDNPSVPNLAITYNLSNRDLIMDPLGRDSFVIFRTEDIASYSKLPTPKTTEVTENTTLYVQIPNSVIIDGVETNKTDPTKLYPRRLSTSIDGGYVAAEKYSSKAVLRKVKKVINGRKILQDTNNSTEDFEIIKANPKGWK